MTPSNMGWRPPPPFLAPEEPFWACVVGKFSLTSRMRNMWSLYLLSRQDSASLSPCHYLYLRESVHRGQTSAAQPGAHLSPASIPLHVSIDHILFIHSSATGHLDGFHLLAILNKAAMDVGVQVSVPYLLSVLLGIHPEMYCWSIW